MLTSPNAGEVHVKQQGLPLAAGVNAKWYSQLWKTVGSLRNETYSSYSAVIMLFFKKKEKLEVSSPCAFDMRLINRRKLNKFNSKYI